MIACCFIARRTNHQNRLKQMSGNIWNICHRCTFNILKLSVYPHRVKWMNNLFCMASVSLIVQGWFFSFWVPCCDALYDFRIQTIYRFIFVRGSSVTRIVVSNSYCVSFLFLFVLCTVYCQFLWIINCWFPLRYSLAFIYIYIIIRYYNWLVTFVLNTVIVLFPFLKKIMMKVI